MPAAAVPALLAEIHTRGTLRVARERDGNAFLAQAASLHPAGFAVLDPGVLLAMPHDKTERVLSAVTATIGGALYPARRERIARLRDVLDAAACRGHTLGGCRFIRWRERVFVTRNRPLVGADPACARSEHFLGSPLSRHAAAAGRRHPLDYRISRLGRSRPAQPPGTAGTAKPPASAALPDFAGRVGRQWHRSRSSFGLQK